MRRALSAAALAAIVGLAACDKALTESYGPTTGTWTYRATDFRPAAATHPDWICNLESTYVFRQEGNQIEGVSSNGRTLCRVGNGPMRPDSFPDGVVRGEIREGRMYITNAGNWHSFGEIQGDRVTGYLESYSSWADEPMVPVKTGTFEMVRVSGDGYEGPRA